MRVTALRIHQPRQRVWRVSIKEGQIQKRFCICIWTVNASANMANRQPLAPLWKWLLWDFSQEFPHVSAHQANVVSAAWDQEWARRAGRYPDCQEPTGREREGQVGSPPRRAELRKAKKRALSNKSEKSWADCFSERCQEKRTRESVGNPPSPHTNKRAVLTRVNQHQHPKTMHGFLTSSAGFEGEGPEGTSTVK